MLMQPEQPIQPTYVPPPIEQNTGSFSSKQKKLIIIAATLLSLFIFVLILGSVLGGQAGPTEKTLTAVNARNAGILSLIDSYEDELSTEDGKAYAAQAKILILSDNNQLVSYTQSQFGSIYDAQQLEDTGLSQTAAALNDRLGQPNFDSDFISTIQFEVDLNKALLEQMNQESIGPNLQEISTTAIKNYQALL